MTGNLGAQSRGWRVGVILMLIAVLFIVSAPDAGALAPASQAAASDIGYSATANATYEDHVVKHRARHGAHRPRSSRLGTGFVPVKRHFQPA